MFNGRPGPKQSIRWLATMAAATLLSLPGTAGAQAAPSVAVRQDPQLGSILTDAQGMTLYLYTKDEQGTSNCYDQCATAWPPLLTDTDPTGPDMIAAGLGLSERADGSQQVTYNGLPLYYWYKDSKPGETTGQNVGGVWFVVNP
jgi:predicted lipoprotein with Yx(FWY)xxD motif